MCPNVEKQIKFMQRLQRDDFIFLFFCVFALFIACCVYAWNAHHQRYYLDFDWIGGAQGIYILIFLCFFFFLICFFQTRFEILTKICKAFLMLYISLVIVEMCNTAILTTPFQTHDKFIDMLDHHLGFHLLSILKIMHGHPVWQQLSWSIYYSLFTIMHTLPLVLICVTSTRVVCYYFATFLTSCIIGDTIYYFFPTMTSPASIYPSQYFTSMQLHTLHSFQAEHLHHTIHFNLIGGVISFPSFHAIWTTIIVYFLWKYCPIYWVRAIFVVYGGLILVTTFLTGWHYLTDVIGGIAVAIFSLYINAKFLLKQQNNSYDVTRQTVDLAANVSEC